jgi:hypothetical protein
MENSTAASYGNFVSAREPEFSTPSGVVKAAHPLAVIKFDSRSTDATRDDLVDGPVEASRTVA